jgi:TonB family protein
MPRPKFPRRVLPALSLGLLAISSLPAQTILVADYNGKPAPVVAARDSRPLVDDHGKLVIASGRRFGLVKAKEFLPVFVAVRNVRVKTSLINVQGNAINNEFHFHGDFSSAYPLKDVFVVFELHPEDGSNSLFLHEIGDLGRNRTRDLDLVVPVSVRVGTGHFKLHLYSRGMEVFNSNQPFAFRESALNRIVARRVKGRKDGPPEPFIGPPPEYPAKLKKNKVRGQALIHLRILPNGAVTDPEVKNATDPAFGESAVEALRQWRFFPQIKDGHPVSTTADMPIDFVPPEKS